MQLICKRDFWNVLIGFVFIETIGLSMPIGGLIYLHGIRPTLPFISTGLVLVSVVAPIVAWLEVTMGADKDGKTQH